MASVLKLRRGTTAQNDAFTGAVGEITLDTDRNELRVHDGSTAGGIVIQNEDTSSGINSFTYTAANNTFEISTPGGDTFTATIDDLQEISDALANLANTNAFISSVASDLDTQEAKQASDLANTNAFISSVASDLDTQEAKQASDLANTNAYIASVDSTRASDLANTNAKLLDIESNLLSTNTDIRSTISTEVSNLVDSAPETLNTLNELASALGDDENFASTLATNLGQKLGATSSVEITGDATASGSFSANSISLSLTLSDSGVVADTYGTATEIPVITVDSKGRITALSNTTVAGVSGFTYETSNNTFSISTADGGVFDATITDLQEVSDALADLANTNAFISSVASDLDTQEAKQASDLANTNAYIASVASDLDTQEAKQASDLANTNAYIASVASDLDTQEAKQASDLANTNSRVATAEGRLDTVESDLNNQESKQASDLANTNAFISRVDSDLTTANNRIDQVIADLDTQEAKQASDLANTNAYIASVDSTRASDLANTNLAIDDRLQVANADARFLQLSGGTLTANLNIGGSIIPTSNVTFDIGSPTARFNELYLAGSTISLGGIQLSINEDGDLNIVDPDTGNRVSIGVTNGIIVANTSVVTSEGEVQVPRGFDRSTLVRFPEEDLQDDDFVGQTEVTQDAFGVDLGGVIYDCNEPKGRIETKDLGAFE